MSIFSIGRYYRSCAVWDAKNTRELVGTSRLSFDKGVPIQERYEAIKNWLAKQGLKCPPYQGNFGNRRRG